VVTTILGECWLCNGRKQLRLLRYHATDARVFCSLTELMVAVTHGVYYSKFHVDWKLRIIATSRCCPSITELAHFDHDKDDVVWMSSTGDPNRVAYISSPV
jgi:hypothetical protein